MRRGRVVAASVLLTMTLAACTGSEPDPDVTAPTFEPASPEPSASEAAPSPSASSEPSEAPTVAAPPLPELATQQTPEGAVAFTEWWFETLNYATATGDTEALREASDPGCGTCQNYLDEIDGAYQNGGRIDGGIFSVQVQPAGEVQQLGVRVAVFADVSSMHIFDSEEAEVETFVAESAVITFSALKSGAGWIAGGLDS